MTADKRDVHYGSLSLMVLKTLEALGPLHGYRIARRIEQISGDQLAMNQGTLYPALVKLEQAGWIDSATTWRSSLRRCASGFTISTSRAASGSYDFGDMPATGIALDSNGDAYAATDFGVLRLPAGASHWENAAGRKRMVVPVVLVVPISPAVNGSAKVACRFTLFAKTSTMVSLKL